MGDAKEALARALSCDSDVTGEGLANIAMAALDAAGFAVVPVDALKQVLLALNGPPHYIRELQVIRSLGNSPIDILLKAIAAAEADNA